MTFFSLLLILSKRVLGLAQELFKSQEMLSKTSICLSLAMAGACLLQTPFICGKPFLAHLGTLLSLSG
jgi:hypothetical protein